MPAPAPDDFLGLASHYLGNAYLPILPQGDLLPNAGYNVLGSGLGLLNPGLLGGGLGDLPGAPGGGAFLGGLGDPLQLVQARNKVQGTKNLFEGLDAVFNPDKDKKAQQANAVLAKQRGAQGTLPGQQAGQFASSVASVPAALRPYVAEAAQQYQLDPALLAAVMQQESGGTVTAVSPAGARGPMQLMPATAAGLGVNPDDPRQNILGGARYLRQQLDAFGGDLDRALAAYNAGPVAVQQYGGVPPFAETQQYVQRIRQHYDRLRAPAPAAPAGAGNPPPGPAQGFLAEAQKLLGVPYVWGGTTAQGVDCSGLILVAAQAAGRPLSGRPTAQGIYQQAQPVTPNAVQPGDLVFFEGTAGANAGERISHVGIVTEQGVMLNAPQPGDRVRYMRYDDPYWQPKIVGFGRLP